MKTQFLSFVFLAAIGCLVLCGCEPEKAPQREPPEVTVSLPVQRDVVDYAEFTGRTSAQESVDIRARVKGFLESADFTDGDMVDKGQKMFVIEQRPFEASLDAAKATKQQTQAAVRLAQADVARNKPLYESRTISAAEYDTLIAKLESAIAKIKADDAAIEQAEIDLSYTEIHSPIRGLAGRKLVDPGNLVGAEESTLLATVVQISPMYVYFDVNEALVLRYLQKRQDGKDTAEDREARTVYVRLDGEQGYPHEGELDYIDNEIDPETGTAQVRGVFPNKDELMLPGMFSRIRVPREVQKDALLVIEEAIGTADLGRKYLLIVDDKNIVHQRYVELGVLIDGMRVIREGLKADERYVSNGLQFARPDRPVKPTMAEEPKAEASNASPVEQVVPEVEQVVPEKEPAAEPLKEPRVEPPTTP